MGGIMKRRMAFVVVGMCLMVALGSCGSPTGKSSPNTPVPPEGQSLRFEIIDQGFFGRMEDIR
jgi:hypothetical protein